MAQLTGKQRWKEFVKSSMHDVQDPVFLTFDLDFFPAAIDSWNNDGITFDMLLRPSIFGDPAAKKSHALSKPKYIARTRNNKRVTLSPALRTPISRVRSVTDTSMMFITPMPPTSSEIAGMRNMSAKMPPVICR